MFVYREILNAIEYRKFNQERDLLAAILGYVNVRLHQMMIKQLNVLRTQIEGGQNTCHFLVNVHQDFFDLDMRNNTWEQWLILLYVTKIKDEKLLNEVIKRLTK